MQKGATGFLELTVGCSITRIHSLHYCTFSPLLGKFKKFQLAFNSASVRKHHDRDVMK